MEERLARLSKMEPDKRERILNAAIEEFASSPYEKASTNNIVQKAGISKGLLFHYFRNKQDLYETVTVFVLHTLYSEMTARIHWEETDLFERITQLVLLKLEYSRIYPRMFDFLMKMLAERQPKDVEGLMALYRNYGLDFRQLYQDVYQRNVDLSRFRDPTTIPETIQIVQWALERFSEDSLRTLGPEETLDMSAAVTRIHKYVEILKAAFYRADA